MKTRIQKGTKTTLVKLFLKYFSPLRQTQFIFQCAESEEINSNRDLFKKNNTKIKQAQTAQALYFLLRNSFIFHGSRAVGFFKVWALVFPEPKSFSFQFHILNSFPTRGSEQCHTWEGTGKYQAVFRHRPYRHKANLNASDFITCLQ